MKVLEPGRLQKGWASEQRCTGAGNGGGGCGALLLVEHGDLFITRSNFCGETTKHITFRCCTCSVLTDISDYRGPRVEGPEAREDS